MVYNRQCADDIDSGFIVVQPRPRSKPTRLKRPVHNVLLSKRLFRKRERQGLVGSLCIRPTRRARLGSRTTTSSGMYHITSSTSYVHVYLATRGCRCSPVGPRWAPARSAGKTAGTITKNAGFLWDTWPNRLVCRLSLQSGNETNDLLKSGPAKAGPAGPAMAPLQRMQTKLNIQWHCYHPKWSDHILHGWF